MALQLVDPGHAALRKASRVAVVMTLMNVLGHTVVDDPGFATFSSFGALALLGFSDFHGPLKVRFGLGVGFSVIGSGLVALGTLASGHLVSSAAMMAIAGFSLTFVAVFGGYPAAGGRGLILATVLAVMLPGGAGDVGGRVLGWLVAGLVGSVAMVALWPEQPRPRVRWSLADIADGVADLLERIYSVTAAEIDRVGGSVRSLRSEIDAALSRPGGARSQDQALLYLLDELGRSIVFVRRILDAGSAAPLAPTDLQTVTASGELFRATADLLHGAGRRRSRCGRRCVDRGRCHAPARRLRARPIARRRSARRSAHRSARRWRFAGERRGAGRRVERPAARHDRRGRPIDHRGAVRRRGDARRSLVARRALGPPGDRTALGDRVDDVPPRPRRGGLARDGARQCRRGRRLVAVSTTASTT